MLCTCGAVVQSECMWYTVSTSSLHDSVSTWLSPTCSRSFRVFIFSHRTAYRGSLVDPSSPVLLLPFPSLARDGGLCCYPCLVFFFSAPPSSFCCFQDAADSPQHSLLRLCVCCPVHKRVALLGKLDAGTCRKQLDVLISLSFLLVLSVRCCRYLILILSQRHFYALLSIFSFEHFFSGSFSSFFFFFFFFLILLLLVLSSFSGRPRLRHNRTRCLSSPCACSSA